MTMFLLIIIYIAFIGLGLPDSLFGTAWPAIYSEFNLSISYGGVVTTIIYTGTMISSLTSAKVISRFGTSKVTAFSTVLTALAILGFSFSGNLLMLCLCAIPLGLGAGAIDTALNNYVSLHYSATQMSLLHCFYGVGVTASPYILSLVMQSEGGWRDGYRMAFVIQFLISIILLITLPIWKQVNGKELQDADEKFDHKPLRELVKIPGVKLMWCLFICSCAIESSCNSWGSTFLVEHRNLTADMAARTIMFYFFGIAVGRLLSGIMAAKIHSWKIIKIFQGILGVAIIIFLVTDDPYLTIVALLMIGIGNGPLFPNFNFLTPENFGQELSPVIMGTQMAVASGTVMIAPVICGILGQKLGMFIFPVFLITFFVIMVCAMTQVRKIWMK